MKQFVVVVLAAALSISGCDDDAPARPGDPDATLRTHEIQPSTPTPEGLAYLEAIAGVHREADRRSGAARTQALESGLSIPVPGDLPEAEVLRLELATRLAETTMERPGGEKVACDLLQPMLAPQRSLPLDRATARALVVLGDAAAKAGDDALAAGSYARAIGVMSMLRQELER
jgi:hypothetical protein